MKKEIIGKLVSAVLTLAVIQALAVNIRTNELAAPGAEKTSPVVTESGGWLNYRAVDLSFRPALYIDTFQQEKVNPKTKYGTPSTPVTVFRGDNVNCDAGACGFQVGFYVFRSSEAGKLTTSVKITNGSSSKVESVTFEPGKKVAEAVVHLPIYNGENKVAVEVDPQNELSESNEKNNRFVVTVILKP